MWYFVAGAILNVAVSLVRMGPMGIISGVQSGYPIQGLLVAAILGALFCGTLFWLVGTFVF